MKHLSRAFHLSRHPLGRSRCFSSGVGHFFDVSVVGAGPTGGALACGLASVAPHLSIAVTDVRPLKAEHKDLEHPDLRVLALSPASRSLLSRIGVWETLEDSGRVAPYYDMRVWDATSPGTLSFSSSDLGAEQLGFVVENSLLQDAIYERLEALPNVTVLAPDTIQDVSDLQPEPSNDLTPLTLTFEHAGVVESSLVLGSDGGNSAMRSRMQITRNVGWRYNQKAVVCSVKFPEGVFCSTAFQRFLPSGPIALLPCFDNFGSIVWSTSPGQADALVKMDAEQFEDELRRAFSSSFEAPNPLFSTKLAAEDPGLPEIEALVGPRASFPLQISQCYPYVRHRFALVGDAAHTVHPLAGQGFNLALGDVSCLVKRVERAVRDGEDIGAAAVLNDYQRERVAQNTFSLAGIDAIQKAFALQFAPFNVARGLGMMAVDKLPLLKTFFMSKAMGSK